MKTSLISPGYGSAFSSEPARKTWLFFIDFIQSTSNSKNDSLFTKNSIWHFVEFSFVWIMWIFQVNQKQKCFQHFTIWSISWFQVSMSSVTVGKIPFGSIPLTNTFMKIWKFWSWDLPNKFPGANSIIDVEG